MTEFYTEGDPIPPGFRVGFGGRLVPLARASDPASSHEAAATAKPSGETAELVLRALRILRRATDEQIFAAIQKRGYRVTPSRTRTVRRELMDCDPPMIRNAGNGTTEAGRTCEAWSLTDAGVAESTRIARIAHGEAA